MWLDTQHGWSVDEDWLYDQELTEAELAESGQLRDEALRVLATTSLDPASWDLPDLALADLRLRRLN